MKATSISRLARVTPAALCLSALFVTITSVPGAMANAPLCRYTTTVNTVFDKETTLTWQRADDGVERSWDQAKSYCMTLSLDNGGWRLPDIQELQTIVDQSRWDPAIDINQFQDSGIWSFWSSTSSASIAGNAWIVNFQSGNASKAAVDTLYGVRCVR